MGKQKNQYFIGKVGNISCYLWKGIPCMRSIPADVHQGSVVKNNTRYNGTSTTMGAVFRQQFAGVLPQPKSLDMQTRLRRALFTWLKYNPQHAVPPNGTLQSISNFSFNTAASLRYIFQVPVQLEEQAPNGLVLHVGAFVPGESINAPAGATEAEITIVAGCCNIGDRQPAGRAEATFAIPLDNAPRPAQQIPLHLDMPTQSLTLIVMSIRFLTAGKPVQTAPPEKWQPCEIIGGIANMDM